MIGGIFMNEQMEFDLGYLVNNYRFWKKEIERLERILYGYSTTMGSWGVAQYGIDAAMPKGSSIRSARELEKMDIREKNQILRLERLQRYVYALEEALDIVDDEHLNTIYDCLLDGMTHRQIAAHLSVSKDYVRYKKQEVFSQISQNSHIRTLLTSQKFAV